MTEQQTVDLVAWLTQIWDEEERQANEALAPAWDGAKSFYDVPGEHRDDWGLWTFHVDPHQVLARIAADRKILELHQPMDNIYGRFECTSCGIAGEFPVRWPCPTLRLLASPYKGREGWQEEWADE